MKHLKRQQSSAASEAIARLRRLEGTADWGSVRKRFFLKTDRLPNACLLWTGAGTPNGYGSVNIFGVMVMAHRVAVALAGRDPGPCLDHTCRTKRCVEQSHLESVSQRENLIRGNGWAGRHARKTHCPRGHPYDIIASGGRWCSKCRRAFAMKFYIANRDSILPKRRAGAKKYYWKNREEILAKRKFERRSSSVAKRSGSTNSRRNRK